MGGFIYYLIRQNFIFDFCCILFMAAKKVKKFLLGMTEKDFSRENFIEGGLIRPAILMTSFFVFIFAMFLLLMGDLKWGGSLIIFAFVLNLYSIYESLSDEKSIFRTMNLGFKFVLFFFEIVAFNWVLIQILN